MNILNSLRIRFPICKILVSRIIERIISWLRLKRDTSREIWTKKLKWTSLIKHFLWLIMQVVGIAQTGRRWHQNKDMSRNGISSRFWETLISPFSWPKWYKFFWSNKDHMTLRKWLQHYNWVSCKLHSFSIFTFVSHE